MTRFANNLSIMSTTRVVLIFLTLARLAVSDSEYEEGVNDWQCQLNHKSPDDFAFSFGFCFKDPSVFCRQHAVTMNGCKKYQNMGLYCCVMENVDKAMVYRHPPWFTRSMFFHIASPGKRMNRIFEFFSSDIIYANITSPVEMAAFLSIVMLDTNFLLNMEEHLPVHIASNMKAHKEKENIKYIGRGAIHVKGKKFYTWMSNKLNEYLYLEDNSTSIHIDAVESPEILLFPTIAFRSAAGVWKNSYSLVENKTLGGFYKSLATQGGVDGLVKILHHLKGDIKQLPELIDLWKRIKSVLKCADTVDPQVSKNEQSVCKYEPLCRGKLLHSNDTCKEDFPKQILCQDCTRSLKVFSIIHPNTLQTRGKREKIIKLFEHVFNGTTDSELTVAFLIPNREFGQRKFRSIDKLRGFLPAMKFKLENVEFADMVNKSVDYLRSLKIQNSKTHKHVVTIVTDSVAELVAPDAIHAITGDNGAGLNLYSLYFEADVADLEYLPLSLRSNLYNIDYVDIVEKFCNDGEFISVSQTKEFTLAKHEKRSYVVRLEHHQRKINIDLVTKQGKISIPTVEKHVWKMPFDKSIKFNAHYNVRSSLNIHDNHSRFKGEDVVVTVRHSPQNTEQKFRPSSLELFIQFEGMHVQNMMEITVSEVPIRAEAMKDNNGTDKFTSRFQYFQVSCIVAACLLFICMLAFIPHSLQLVVKIKREIDRIKGQHNAKYDQHNSKYGTKHAQVMISNPCKDCNLNIHSETAYSRLYQRDNGNLDVNVNCAVRRNSFLIFPGGENNVRCKLCTKRVDVLIITIIHFMRIMFLLVFELILMTAIHETHRKIECSISSGTLTFLSNIILMLCLTEMLCYCGLKDGAQKKLWWTFVFGYCVLIAVATELTRLKIDRVSCWPAGQDLQGRLIFASTVLITTVLVLIFLYYFRTEKKRSAGKIVYCLLLMAICLFYAVDLILVEMVARDLPNVLFPFILFNITTNLLVFLFTVAIQARVQNWFKGFFNGKTAIQTCRKFHDKEFLIPSQSECSTQQNYFVNCQWCVFDLPIFILESPRRTCDCSEVEGFKIQDFNGNTLQPQLKKVSLVPTHLRTCSGESMTGERMHQTSASVPAYTIESVFHANSNGKLYDDGSSLTQNDYDDAFEIIVRAKRPRSASAMVTSSMLLEPKQIDSSHHHSAEIYNPTIGPPYLHRQQQQQQQQQHEPQQQDLKQQDEQQQRQQHEAQLEYETFDVSKFVTNLAPVISFHHRESEN